MSDGSPRARTRRFFGGISVATRISAAVVIVSLLSLQIATVIGLTTGRNLGEDLYEDQIRSMRSSGSFDVNAYLNSLESTIESLASSPQAGLAVASLSDGLEQLDAEEPTDLRDRADKLATAYQEQYLAPLGEAGQSIDIRDVIDENNIGAVYLQSTYSVGFEPLASASVVNDARDGSAWTATHAAVHPTYRPVVSRLKLSDLLLVDTESGRIVYSVEKRPDVGANVDVGPVSGSIVSTLTDSIRDNPNGVVAADFQRYDPAVLTPVAGLAAPILDSDEQLVGAFIFLFDSAELTRILTLDDESNEAAFPTGSDLYVIGVDATTRSEPRGFLNDRQPFLDAAELSGQLTEEDRVLVDVAGTTVLTLRAAEATGRAAADGDNEVSLRKTIDGRDAFSSVDQVPYEGFTLYVVAEVDSDAARAGLDDFESLLIVGVALFVVLLAFAAVSWSISIVRPVRSLSDRLAVGAPQSDEPIEVPDRSPIEFHRLASRFEVMARALREHHVQLAEARRERLELMKRMLPSSVAERLAAGDAQSLEEAPDASVVVLTLDGLDVALDVSLTDDPTVADPSGMENRRAGLEELFAQLDDLARHHGLEPIKIIGDEYYATIGHERPYIDHAPRAIAFAADAFDLIRDSRLHAEEGLELSAGVASGAVTVGLTGTNHLLYDVWGVTVRRADQLARRAGPGRLLASENTVSKLPDTIRVSEFERITGQMAWIVDHERTRDRS